MRLFIMFLYINFQIDLQRKNSKSFTLYVLMIETVNINLYANFRHKWLSVSYEAIGLTIYNKFNHLQDFHFINSRAINLKIDNN